MNPSFVVLAPFYLCWPTFIAGARAPALTNMHARVHVHACRRLLLFEHNLVQHYSATTFSTILAPDDFTSFL